MVAVSRFENSTSFASNGYASIGTGLADQLTDSLIQSGGFVVLERQVVSDVIGEQNLANSGRVQRSQSARAGKITAAQVLIKGTITEFDINANNSDGGFKFAGLELSKAKSTVHIGLVIRLIDTTTSEVLASVRVEGKAESKESSFGLASGDLDVGSNLGVRTPIDKASQMAIDHAVVKIAHQLKDRAYRGRIVKVTKRGLYISASKRDGTKVGDKFTVLSVGEEITDPYTGELLGRETLEIGNVVVTDVKERYAIGSSTNTTMLNSVKVGDFIAFDSRVGTE